jgi:hypothetical protein
VGISICRRHPMAPLCRNPLSSWRPWPWPWWLPASPCMRYGRSPARSRSVTLASLLIGGAISYFNEPIDDVLGLVWHPVIGQWTALDTFARVPLWGLGIYIVFFGGMPYLILQSLRRGVTRWHLWGWVGVLAVDVAVELPILASGIYSYYGDAPVRIGGFPVYWIVINAVGPLALAMLLLAAGDTFTGWRAGVFALSSDGVRRGGQCRGWMADLQRTQCPSFRAGAMAGRRTDHCDWPCRAGPADRLRGADVGGAAAR